LRLSLFFRAGNHLRIQGLLEAFNITNRVNVITLNGNFGPGTYPDAPSLAFRSPTAVGDPRTLQVAVRVSW